MILIRQLVIEVLEGSARLLLETMTNLILTVAKLWLGLFNKSHPNQAKEAL